jgi:hypothetical protein
MPLIIATDECDEVAVTDHVDLCGVGVKDMGDTYGFGGGVFSFSEAAICKDEKIGLSNTFGNGEENITFGVYLDTDGTTTGGCAAPHDSTEVGYEFMLKYEGYWDSSASKAEEETTSYKCASGVWTVADVSLSTWKQKMCSEINGPMVAVEKGDLEKFPTLYDESQDMRVLVATAKATDSLSSPSDTAGPGYMTPGSIDFIIQGFSDFGVGAAFEGGNEHGYTMYEDCYNSVDDDEDTLVDCNDWDCQYASVCETTGVNAVGYSDTTAPKVTGVRIEEYRDGALIMYDTSKPTNGTLTFWGDDATCSQSELNRTVSDRGLLSTNMSTYKLWHVADVYLNGEIEFNLNESTKYYYKLKVCDNNAKCATSACSSFVTASTGDCPYCDFVTRVDAPTGWTVSYDLDVDGTFEHVQGSVCGPNAGMKTNYSSGRTANLKLSKSTGEGMTFYGVHLTKSGLTSHIRDVDDASDFITGSDLVGMVSSTRDKILNNLHPDHCYVDIPTSDGTCDELFHCDDAGENCVDETSSGTLVSSTSSICTWEIPYCEFSTWASAEGSTSSAPSTSTGAGSSGSSSSSEGLSSAEEEETIIDSFLQRAAEVFGLGDDEVEVVAEEVSETEDAGTGIEFAWLWLGIGAALAIVALILFVIFKRH